MRKMDGKRLVGLPMLATAALAASAPPAGAEPGVTIFSFSATSDIVIRGSASADRVALARSGATVVVKTGGRPSIDNASGCTYVGFDGTDHVTHCPARDYWIVALNEGDDVFSADDVPGWVSVTGNAGSDNLTMVRTRGSVEGNAGNDSISTWDGFGPNVRQDVACGKGSSDRAFVNWGDTVGTGCENLTRK